MTAIAFTETVATRAPGRAAGPARPSATRAAERTASRAAGPSTVRATDHATGPTIHQRPGRPGRPAQAAGVRACLPESTPPTTFSQRGRLTITLCVLITALLFVTGVVPTSAPVPQTTAVVTVDAGDTLWSIARSSAPQANIPATIERIRELNALGEVGDGASLPVGLELTVPHG